MGGFLKRRIVENGAMFDIGGTCCSCLLPNCCCCCLDDSAKVAQYSIEMQMVMIWRPLSIDFMVSTMFVSLSSCLARLLGLTVLLLLHDEEREGAGPPVSTSWSSLFLLHGNTTTLRASILYYYKSCRRRRSSARATISQNRKTSHTLGSYMPFDSHVDAYEDVTGEI